MQEYFGDTKIIYGPVGVVGKEIEEKLSNLIGK